MRRKPDNRRMVLAIFEAHGPLTDAQLMWYARVALKMNPATAQKIRWRLTEEKRIAFAKKVLVTGNGRVQKFWELRPVPRPQEITTETQRARR